MRPILIATFLGVVLFAVSSLSAHHNASSKYDMNKPITVTGQVTKVEWMNPHIYFYIDVTDESGNVINYAIENGSVAGFFRRGVSRDSLKNGDTIVVSGFLARLPGLSHINGRSVTFSDGRQVFVGSNDGLPDAAGGQR